MSGNGPREPVKKGQVYVLKLRAGKWYVGFTTKAGTRPEQHAKKRGAKWTKKYAPIDPIPYSMSEPIYTVEDEDKITLALMAEHGIRNVRGGQWCMVDMKAYTAKELEGLIPKSKSKKGSKCSRCGRDSHNRSRCYAVTTVDGVTITSKAWKYRPKATPKKKAKSKPKGFIAPGYKRDRYGRVVAKSAADYAFDRAEAAKKKARKRKSKGDKKAKRTYTRYRKGGRKGGR